MKVTAWCFVPYIPVENPVPVTRQSIAKDFSIETVIMLLASFLIAAAVIDRLVYREVLSMIFVFPNNWAHWTVALTMYRYGRDGVNLRYFRIFCWLMLAGDVVKLIFFAVHDFTRLEVARYVSPQQRPSNRQDSKLSWDACFFDFIADEVFRSYYGNRFFTCSYSYSRCFMPQYCSLTTVTFVEELVGCSTDLP